MKRTVGLALLALFSAGMVFAEVKAKVEGYAGLKINEMTHSRNEIDGDVQTDKDNVSWGYGDKKNIKVVGTLEAENEKKDMGLVFNIKTNGTEIGIGDEAKVWAKLGPAKFQFGRIREKTLRGSSVDWKLRDIPGVKLEDDVFAMFNPKMGMAVSAGSSEGFFAGLALDAGDENGIQTEDMLKNIHAGIGYTNGGLFGVKAAYKGNAAEDHYGRIELGASVFAVQNNTIELGVKIPLAKDNADGYVNIIGAVIGKAGQLDYKGHIYADIGRETGKSGSAAVKPSFGFDFGAEYALEAFSVGATGKYGIAFMNDSGNGMECSYMSNSMGILAYVKKPFSGGYLMAGIGDECTFTSESEETDGAGKIKEDSVRNQFFIPVGIQFKL